MMNQIRTVIIDDDPYIRYELRERLSKVKDIEVMADLEHPLEAVEFLKKYPPDLIFLDIQMPVMNGFELLDAIDTKEVEIIFITSFDKFAIQAIRYSALDYLLKPIQEEELTNAIERYRGKAARIPVEARLNNLRHNLDPVKGASQQLVIPTKQGEHHFPVQEIIRCEADSNYTLIFLDSGRKFVASKTLGDIEVMIGGDDFIRVHKSHLINRSHAIQLTSDDHVVLSDQSRIAVSRRRIADVRGALRNI